MKKGYTIAYLNYLASACFFIAGIIALLNGNSMGTTWICLGAVWLCIGSSSLVNAGKKQREEEEKENASKEAENESDEEAD